MPVTPLRRTARVLIGAAAIGLLVGAQPAAAQPAPAPGPASSSLLSTAPASDTITWAVDPATADGPDGRAWAELDLDPGEVVTDHLAVRNLGEQEATFALKAADGYFTDKGRFSMLTSSQTSTAAGTWIEVQDAVTVEPGGTVVVPFTVTVPENATPGDHAAGIAASVTMINGSGSGAMDVESRIGFRVMTRVSGEIAPGLVVDQLSTSYDMTWNPVAPGAIGATVMLSNTGNVALTVDGTASAGGSTSALGFTDGAPAVELLPGDSRLVSATITDVWPMGPIDTEITAAARIQGTDTVVPAVAAAVTTWALPWSQLLVLAGVALLILAWRSGRRGSRRRRQELLDQAREEGRSQAERELQPATGPDRS